MPTLTLILDSGVPLLSHFSISKTPCSYAPHLSTAMVLAENSPSGEASDQASHDPSKTLDGWFPRVPPYKS